LDVPDQLTRNIQLSNALLCEVKAVEASSQVSEFKKRVSEKSRGYPIDVGQKY